MVLREARARGWRGAHFGTSMRQTRGGFVGERDAAGFPDLVLVRERVIFAELKMHERRSKLTANQQAWIDALLAAGEHVYVWRPNDWDELLAVLTHRITVVEVAL